MSASRSGRCLCGAVAFEAAMAEPHTEACHCSTCRKWGGGPAFSTAVESLTLPDIAPVAWFASSDHAERGFCKACGTHLFWRMRDGGYTVVYAGAFDETEDLPLTSEIFVDEQPGTYAFTGNTKRMTGAEVVAAFGGDSP